MRAIAALLVLVLALSAAPLASATSLTPLIVGWERFFKLEWHAPAGNGHPITGYILNDWGFPATRIQLLVEGLAQDGQVLNQRVEWLGTLLTPGMRAYFEVPAPGPAPTYRVRVFAFDWLQGSGSDQLR
jgi:hypothetical protein